MLDFATGTFFVVSYPATREEGHYWVSLGSLLLLIIRCSLGAYREVAVGLPHGACEKLRNRDMGT